MRLIKSIFLSSLIVIPLFVIFITFSGDLSDGLVALPIAYCVGLVGVTLIGVPVHYCLHFVGIRNTVVYVLLGLFVPAFVFWCYNFSSGDKVIYIFFQGLFFGFFGACCAYVFKYSMFYFKEMKSKNMENRMK